MDIDQNHLKLDLIIKGRATVILRQIFMKRWKLINKGEDWVNSKENGSKFINGIGKRLYNSGKKLQKLSLESGDIDKWDLTLMASVLPTIKPAKDHQQNDRTTEEQENIVLKKNISIENKYIEKLLTIRNKCAHSPTLSLTDEEFNELWDEMALILVSLGDSEEELEVLKKEEIINWIGSENAKDVENEIRAKALELKKIGNDRLKKQEFSEAIDKYTEALDLKGLNNRDKAVVLSNRSVAYLKLIDFQGLKSGSMSGPIDHSDLRYKALLDAKQAVELSPLWWRGYHRIGCAYHALNKYSKAIVYFDRALAIDQTKQEVRDSRDESRFKFSAEQRFEHFDWRTLPLTTEEHLNKVNENGFVMTREMFEKMDKTIDILDTSTGDVTRGHRHLEGTAGFKQDYEMAATYFARAASNGNAEGMYNLALMTSKGLGVKKDYKLVIELLEKAAEQPTKRWGDFPNIGVAEAQHALGICYADGIGVDKDFSVAFKWYSKSSENGYALAANNIGLMLRDGLGVKRNLKKAEQYFILSATRKDPNAMINLANLYLGFRDTESARLWYERAINNGHLYAKLNKEKFEKQASAIDEEINKLLSDFESRNGINSDGLTIRERSKRMHSFVNNSEEMPESIKELENFLLPKKAVTNSNEKTGDNHEFDLKNIKKTTNLRPISFHSDRISRLTDPNRIELIRNHRKSYAETRTMKDEYNIMKSTRPALQKQKAPKTLTGLKPITLREMDPTKDHVYEGFVMQITFIEDAITGWRSIRSLIEDENGDCQRCFIYNFEHENNDSIVQKTYGFGNKTSLNNPYMRMAYDLKPGIRIDDPKTLIRFSEEEKIVDMCRYCGKGDAKKVCSSCKKAQYCDRNCQKNDWKIYKHKLICLNPNQ